MQITPEHPAQEDLPEPRGVEPGDTVPNPLGPIPRPYTNPEDWDLGQPPY